MKVLFDTNVVLDVLMAREPHVEAAAALFSLIDKGHIQGALCATTLTTLHYLAAKALGTRKARSQIQRLLELFEVADVTQDVLRSALTLKFPDFEDAVLHEAARLSGVDAIVTRNGKDFGNATLPVLAPQELLTAIYAART